jgi:hypothetical protein
MAFVLSNQIHFPLERERLTITILIKEPSAQGPPQLKRTQKKLTSPVTEKSI